MDNQTIVVAGAGTIGCYLGGLLQAGGSRVVLWGRARMVEELGEFGLTLTDLDGGKTVLAPGEINAGSDPALLADADVILITVKSGATAEIARSVANYARPGSLVLSFQNGVGNVALLKSLLPQQRVAAGMVPFNVVHLGNGRFHRATAGALAIDITGHPMKERLSLAGLEVVEHADMQSIAWGKLLVNLNNALNALSGLPLAEQLANRAWRNILADCVAEGLRALKRAGIRPGRTGPMPAWVFPHVLRLPDWLFRRIARAQLQIDPLARSSMWEDLERLRTTEIDYLQGAVVDLAHQYALDSPVNAKVQALVHRAEADQKGSPRLDPRDVVAGAQ